MFNHFNSEVKISIYYVDEITTGLMHQLRSFYTDVCSLYIVDFINALHINALYSVCYKVSQSAAL